MAQPIPVSRGMAAAVSVVILVLVGAVGFLAGRQSVPQAPPPAPPVVATTTAPPAAVLPPVSPVPLPVPPPPPLATVVDSGDAVREPASDERDREAVRTYFQRIDLELASGSGLADPQRVALEALKDLSGDSVRTIAKDQRATRARVANIVPPPPCAEHHRRMLAVIERGAAMLERIPRAMTPDGAGALGGISDDAKEVEAEARAVDALAVALKARFGLST